MAAVLQYRATKPDVQTARQLAMLCRRFGVLFIVNNDVHLAKESAADGVHLGANDMPIIKARKYLGDSYIIGATCGGDFKLAQRRIKDGADYCAFGAVYKSPTKPQKALCPLAAITKAKAVLDVPIIAIGGITPANAAMVIKSGADALALSSGIFTADNPAKAAKEIAALY